MPCFSGSSPDVFSIFNSNLDSLGWWVGFFFENSFEKRGRFSFDIDLLPSLTTWQHKQLHDFKREADAKARLNSEQGEGTAASPASGDGFIRL